MNTEKRIIEAMELIEARIKEKQADVKENEKNLIKYKEDKIRHAYNQMAMVCQKAEINALRQIYITLKGAKYEKKEIRITF